MTFTLLIGNNFIFNSPKSVRYNDKTLFRLEQDQSSNNPNISVSVLDQSNNQIVNVEKNVLKECSSELIKKKSEPRHVLVVDKSGEIIFESYKSIPLVPKQIIEWKLEKFGEGQCVVKMTNLYNEVIKKESLVYASKIKKKILKKIKVTFEGQSI